MQDNVPVHSARMIRHSWLRLVLRTKGSWFCRLPRLIWTRSKISGWSSSGAYIYADRRQFSSEEALWTAIKAFAESYPLTNNKYRESNTCSQIMLVNFIDKYILKYDIAAQFTLKDIQNELKLYIIRPKLLPWVGPKYVVLNRFRNIKKIIYIIPYIS